MGFDKACDMAEGLCSGPVIKIIIGLGSQISCQKPQNQSCGSMVDREHKYPGLSDKSLMSDSEGSDKELKDSPFKKPEDKDEDKENDTWSSK